LLDALLFEALFLPAQLGLAFVLFFRLRVDAPVVAAVVGRGGDDAGVVFTLLLSALGLFTLPLLGGALTLRFLFLLRPALRLVPLPLAFLLGALVIAFTLGPAVSVGTLALPLLFLLRPALRLVPLPLAFLLGALVIAFTFGAALGVGVASRAVLVPLGVALALGAAARRAVVPLGRTLVVALAALGGVRVARKHADRQQRGRPPDTLN
jgi:hypothetical protein